MPEPTLPPELILAIGRVTVNGTRLESDVTVLLYGVVAASSPSAFGNRPSPPTFAHLIDELRRFSAAEISGPASASLTKYLNEAKNLQGMRHDVVHGIWHIEVDRRGRHRLLLMRKPVTVKRMSVSQVDELADRLHRHRGTLIPVLGQLRHALPADRMRNIVALPPHAAGGMRATADMPGTAGERPIRSL